MFFRSRKKVPLNTTDQFPNAPYPADEPAPQPKPKPKATLKNFDKSWVPTDYRLFVFEFHDAYKAVCAMKHSVSDKYRKDVSAYGPSLPYYSVSLKAGTGDVITDEMVLQAFTDLRKMVESNKDYHDKQIAQVHKAYLARTNPAVVESKNKFLRTY